MCSEKPQGSDSQQVATTTKKKGCQGQRHRHGKKAHNKQRS